ncbi:MAG: HEPN domain-containing protein [Bryobacteraceae bacterium]|jgi:HEPN domain-containing protein
MPHDPARVAEVRAWLLKARRDLETAEYELRADPPFSGDIAFHSQQAVEKALKAFLSWHGVPFRKTHNLVELGGACCQIEPALEPLLRAAAPLTEYAWRFRYPGDPEEPAREEAADALSTARQVFAAILGHLPPEARP